MVAKDWTKLFQDDRYKGRWVALSRIDEQTVVASGKTAKEALIQAQALGYYKAPLMRVPENLTYLVG
jgi:hypothetical protein